MTARRSALGIAPSAALALVLVASSAAPARAALTPQERALVRGYVGALAAARYASAFALLSPDERRYFGTPAHFASVFVAGGVRISSFVILASKRSRAGTVALVSEHIRFYDERSSTTRAATATVAYGIVAARGQAAIKDPFHPWQILAPPGLSAENGGVSVSVRSLSFYSGRLQLVATFANRSNVPVTFLPYGRSTLRDARGAAYAPIASRLPGLTDATLYTGLRLSPSAQYTGLMTFLTPARFEPGTLTLTLAPVLADGSNRPFALVFPPLAVPK